jgi:hypothetical protein
MLVSRSPDEGWINEYGMNGSMLVGELKLGSSILIPHQEHGLSDNIDYSGLVFDR